MALAMVTGLFSTLLWPAWMKVVGTISLLLATISQMHGVIKKYAVPPSSLPQTRVNTVVRIGIGLNNHEIPGKPLEHSGGSVPMIVAFDESKEFLGMSKFSDTYINNGAYVDVEVHHLKDRQKVQAPYLQILGRGGAICVAYVLETWSDDSHRMWTGMQGPACGYKWGFSNIILGHLKNETVFKPCKSWH